MTFLQPQDRARRRSSRSIWIGSDQRLPTAVGMRRNGEGERRKSRRLRRRIVWKSQIAGFIAVLLRRKRVLKVRCQVLGGMKVFAIHSRGRRAMTLITVNAQFPSTPLLLFS